MTRQRATILAQQQLQIQDEARAHREECHFSGRPVINNVDYLPRRESVPTLQQRVLVTLHAMKQTRTIHRVGQTKSRRLEKCEAGPTFNFCTSSISALLEVTDVN